MIGIQVALYLMNPDVYSEDFEMLQSRLQQAVESAQTACDAGCERGARERFMRKWTCGLRHQLHISQCILVYSDVQFFSKIEEHYAVLQTMDALLNE